MQIKSLIINIILIFCFSVPVWAQSDEVRFSSNGGVYSKAFSLTLKCQNSSHHIRYTLNGSTPDQNSLLYTNPLLLNNDLCSRSDIYKIPISPENEFYLPDSVVKGIVIRAAAFDSQENRVSPVVTQSYFIRSLGCDLHSLPVISICTDSLSLFAHDTGILVPGDLFDPEDLDHSGNYAQSGREWERLVNVEYYAERNNGFNQLAGLRTHGGIRARRAQQKGLKIYAREEYGKKNFKYKIFEESDLKKFKHLIIRPFRNACSPAGINDWMANHIAAPLNMGTTASRPVVLFLNGEYWGIYFFEEKVDERYLESHFEVNPDSVNIISSWGTVEAGTSDSWFSLYYWLMTADLSDPAQYSYFANKIDIPNIIDYYIFELFSANWDWPNNNVRCWQTMDDGPWRWVFYDGDCCLDNLEYDVYMMATFLGEYWSSSEWATLFFRKLLENETFKNQYLTRLEEVNKKYFTYKRTKPYLKQIIRLLEDEIPHQSQRFNNPQNEREWKRYCREIDLFLSERENRFWIETKEFFHLKEAEISSVTCYPNPIRQGNNLNLQIATDEDCTVWCSVYDLNGRFIHGQYFFLPKGDNKVQLNMEFFSGIYFIKMGSFTKKVVIINP